MFWISKSRAIFCNDMFEPGPSESPKYSDLLVAYTQKSVESIFFGNLKVTWNHEHVAFQAPVFALLRKICFSFFRENDTR